MMRSSSVLEQDISTIGNTRKSFRSNYSFEVRRKESTHMRQKYPDRFPVICERSPDALPFCPFLQKSKFLVPHDLTLGQFIAVIRNHMRIDSEKAVYLFFDGIMHSLNKTMRELYFQHVESDGFLYATYTFEKTFGGSAPRGLRKEEERRTI